MSLILPRRKLLTAAAASLALSAPAIVRAQIFNPPMYMPTKSGFNPASLVTGSGGFWRADMGVTQSGGAVTQWNDQSANGNNLTLSDWSQTLTSPTFSSTGFNTSYPGISCPSSGGFIGVCKNHISFTGSGQTMSIFLLVNLPSGTLTDGDAIVSLDNTTFGTDGSNNAFNMQSRTSGAPFELQGPTSLQVGAAGIHLIGYTLNATVCASYADGVAGGTAVPSFTIGNGTDNFQFSVGGNSARFNPVFTAAFVLFTDTIISPTNVTNLKNWSNTNWGTSF
jgi:hypothetical protein